MFLKGTDPIGSGPLGRQRKEFSRPGDGADAAPFRILIYTHDTYGLGNIRRMLAVAEALVADDPRIHVLVITGSPMIQGFRVAPRIDFVKLPCLERDHAGTVQARSLPLALDRVVRMRADLIRSTLLSFEPDLLLVDKKPLGIEGELGPALEAMERLPRPPALALLLRDILDAPEVTWRIWERNRYHEVIRRYYDLILVAGQPEVFDLAREYRFPMSSRRLVRYCGYIQRREISAAPAGGGAGSPPRVLVAVGGGGDGAHLIRNYLEGLRRGLSRQPQMRGTVITGPEIPARARREIEALARQLPGQQLHEFCDDMAGALAEADLVVGMCGYNSVCEVLAAGRRAVVVPRVAPVAEQWIRASRFAEKGLLRAIHPRELNPAALHAEIDAALAGPAPRAAAHLDFSGLERICHWVQRLLFRQRGMTPVQAPPVPPSSMEQRSAANV